MRHFKLYITGLFIGLSLASCSNDDLDTASRQDILSADSLYVSLTIDMGDASFFYTRASNSEPPNGGEEGDGWEYGRDYENRLHDFTVFVLGYDNTINSPATVPFIAAKYFSPADVETATTSTPTFDPKNYDSDERSDALKNKNIFTYSFKIPVLHDYPDRLPEADSYRFIVVANCGDLTTTYTTLGALRDGIPSQTYTYDSGNGTYSRFVMTNENDNIYHGGTGTENDPVLMHTTIERMAARIDFDPAGSTVYEDGGNKSLRYSLLADESNPSSTVLAELYLDNIRLFNVGRPSSYFIKRVADDISGANLTYLGDELPVPSGIQTNFVIEPNSANKTVANKDDNTKLTTWYGDTRLSAVSAAIQELAAPDVPATGATAILGYANENTFSREATLSSYATGLALKCRFVPKHDFYTAYDASTGTLTAGTYTIGSDFWMVEPDQGTVTEQDRKYFSTAVAANAYAADTGHKRFGKVTAFTGGVCYYISYLRHSNNTAVIHNTMEFATVRNNIYRFRLNAATGPGTPTLDARQPEELKARVYVKKWLLVEHPTINM